MQISGLWPGGVYGIKTGCFAITIRFDVISAIAAGSGVGALIRNKPTDKSTAAFMKLLALRL